MNFSSKYKKQFMIDIKQYSSIKKQIEKKVKVIIENPYYNSEPLGKINQYDLRGLRSKRIDRNFRIIFAICEECRKMFSEDNNEKVCKFCNLEFSVKTIIFFTVKPHKIVYKNKKPLK